MKNKKGVKFGFTLAEIMVVLATIGILTAIIFPVALNSAPDKNVMNFKKGHNTLTTTIKLLVESDKYYKDGNLGIKADGTVLVGNFSLNSGATTSNSAIIKYFCNSFADIIATKQINCSTAKTAENDTPNTFVAIPTSVTQSWHSTMPQGKARFDEACANKASAVGAEIVTPDDIIFYQANPGATFGVQWGVSNPLFGNPNTTSSLLENYKVFCMDVDGIGYGEAPFGYGIRVDGKVLTGARADEWLLKTSN